MSNAIALWLLRLGLTALGAVGALWLTRKEEPGPGKFLRAMGFLLPFAAGGYYTVAWALAGLGGLIWLLWWSRGHDLVLRWSLGAATLCITVALYCLGPIWAADRGSAMLALGRAPALVVLVLILMQGDEEPKSYLRLLPQAGAAITMVSILLSWIPGAQGLVVWRQRLSGTFEYANSYALFLLLGLILSGAEKRRGWGPWLQELLLVLGILLSGSRTTLVLLGFSWACLWITLRDGPLVARNLGALAGALVLCELYKLGNGADSAAGRILATGAGDSSFLTRVLYWKDAMSVILRHPLGLGYLGYRAVQGSIQHGVYHVTYVHNGLLQLALDVGWLPAVVMLGTLLWEFFRRGAGLWRRLMIFAFAVHAMMDFDLEFLSLWLVLLCLMGLNRGRQRILAPGQALVALSILIAFGLYLALGDTLYRLGDYQACLRLEPFHTQALVREMQQEDETERREQLADRVLRLNPYATAAWEEKARAAQSRGNVQAMMAASERVLEYSPYEIGGYQRYFDRLWACYQRYDRAGKRREREICRQALLELPQRLRRLRETSDPLAFRIQHKPECSLGPSYQMKLRQIQ